jgi:transcriptional regulator with XRE-family HTH domain
VSEELSSESAPAERPPRPVPPQSSLLAWRRKLGLTQRQAGKLLGISQGHYCHLEMRQQTPSARMLRHLVAMTGVPADILMRVDDGE